MVISVWEQMHLGRKLPLSENKSVLRITFKSNYLKFDQLYMKG